MYDAEYIVFKPNPDSILHGTMSIMVCKMWHFDGILHGTMSIMVCKIWHFVNMIKAMRRVLGFGRYQTNGPSAKDILKVKDKKMDKLPHISYFVDQLTREQVRGKGNRFDVNWMIIRSCTLRNQARQDVKTSQMNVFVWAHSLWQFPLYLISSLTQEQCILNVAMNSYVKHVWPTSGLKWTPGKTVYDQIRTALWRQAQERRGTLLLGTFLFIQTF